MGAGNDQAIVGYIFRNRRTSGDSDIVAQGERRDENAVRSRFRAIANGGDVFVLAIVVGSNRTRADIHLLAQLGIAQVSQVRRVGAIAQSGILQLDKISNAAGLPHRRAAA